MTPTKRSPEPIAARTNTLLLHGGRVFLFPRIDQEMTKLADGLEERIEEVARGIPAGSMCFFILALPTSPCTDEEKTLVTMVPPLPCTVPAPALLSPLPSIQQTMAAADDPAHVTALLGAILGAYRAAQAVPALSVGPVCLPAVAVPYPVVYFAYREVILKGFKGELEELPPDGRVN